MKIQIQFRQMEPTAAIKEYVEKRVSKFEKFISYEMDVHVILGTEKLIQFAEVTCHAEHREIVAISKTKDMYEAIDLVCHKIEAQLKKEREKKKGHAAAHKISRTKPNKIAADIHATLPHGNKRVSR